MAVTGHGTCRSLEDVYPIGVWSIIPICNGLTGLSAAHIGSLKFLCQWPDGLGSGGEQEEVQYLVVRDIITGQFVQLCQFPLRSHFLGQCRVTIWACTSDRFVAQYWELDGVIRKLAKELLREDFYGGGKRDVNTPRGTVVEPRKRQFISQQHPRSFSSFGACWRSFYSPQDGRYSVQYMMFGIGSQVGIHDGRDDKESRNEDETAAQGKANTERG